jgi:hypothetical protein
MPAKPKTEPAIYDRRRRPLVRRQAIQKRYDISPRCLDNWMRLRRIPYLKVGGILFFNVEACDEALKRFEVKARE